MANWYKRFRSVVGGRETAGETVLGVNRRNADFVHACNPRRFFPLADDKILAKQALVEAGVPVPRTLGVVRGFFEAAHHAHWLSRKGDGVVKPSHGKGGGGVRVLRPGDAPDVDPDRLMGELRNHFGDILSGVYSGGVADVALIEERLLPHPRLSDLWGPSLIDARVILHECRRTMAMLRVPTEASAGRSNLHAGGVGIAVNLSTGVTEGGFWRGRPIAVHPDTGGALAGIQVPDWDRVLEISDLSARHLPLGYLGVDVALDGERGPFVLEVNVRPGLEIQNVNHLGLLAAMERSER